MNKEQLEIENKLLREALEQIESGNFPGCIESYDRGTFVSDLQWIARRALSSTNTDISKILRVVEAARTFLKSTEGGKFTADIPQMMEFQDAGVALFNALEAVTSYKNTLFVSGEGDK